MVLICFYYTLMKKKILKMDQTLQHLGGDEELYKIKPINGKSYQISRRSLKDNLSELSKYGDYLVENLSPAAQECFQQIKDVLKTIKKDSASMYAIAIEDIHTVFTKNNGIMPGTVKSYFIGCSSSNNYPGGSSCDPRCIGSLGYEDLPICQSNIVRYQKGKPLTVINRNESSDEVYIDIDTEEQLEIDQKFLNNNNVTVVQRTKNNDYVKFLGKDLGPKRYWIQYIIIFLIIFAIGFIIYVNRAQMMNG